MFVNRLNRKLKIAGIDPVRNHARVCAPEGPAGRAISNGVDTGFGFAIIKLLNLTALSACRDGGFYFYNSLIII